jgi:hypothetical protein
LEKTEFWHDAWILHHDTAPTYEFCPKIGNRMWSSTRFGTEKLLAIPKIEDCFEEHFRALIPGFQQYFYKWKHRSLSVLLCRATSSKELLEHISSSLSLK